MTLTPTAAPLPGPTSTLPPEVIERLNRIRLHADGLTEAQATRLVEQAFRNFHGINTDLLVRYLIHADQ